MECTRELMKVKGFNVFCVLLRKASQSNKQQQQTKRERRGGGGEKDRRTKVVLHVFGVFEHSGRYLHTKSSMKDEKGVDVGEGELRSSPFSTILARSLPVDEVIKE